MNQPHSNSKIVLIAAFIGAIATITGAIITKKTPDPNPRIINPLNPIVEDVTSETESTIETQVELAGCNIKTGQMTHLYLEPDPFSAKLRVLPDHEKYKVIEIKKDNWNSYWFKIKDAKTVGWVMNFQCDSVSPDCFD
ncbi:MAG: hypothetical protein IPM42_14710 [Saprospiraceae bacterium]|nr:hypothetical protein [Saprospiraceae bacterium]